MRVTIFLGATVLAGCLGGREDPPPCAEYAQGNFVITYTRTSGDCGPVDEALAMLGGPISADWERYPCSGTDIWSEDACNLRTEGWCAQNSMIGYLEWHFEATASWVSPDVLAGTQALTFWLDGAPHCAGSYDIAFTRF